MTIDHMNAAPARDWGRATRGIALSLLMATAFPGVTAAQTLPVAAADGRIEQLKPGEFLWAPEIAPAGPVTIIVSLKTQKAYAYRNGVAIGVSTVSTGTEGFATPTGVFTVLQKDADHVSNLYKDAAMPFMQRLTWGGIAMHAGNLPGYPASHGCIRMPLAFAKALFGITRMGITVVITQDALVPVVVPTPGMLKRGVAAPRSDGAFAWNPALSPTGPVSIVVSGRDSRVVVLRNGIEIGSSAIVLDTPVDRTAAFTLQAVDADGEHWLRLPLPGETRTGELSAADRAKGRLPEGFRAALATVLTPGATLLVTRETLASAGTGTPVTIIETDAR
ncbi:L,D-transpeptidase [Sphingomonas arantia]|uniref:L,D-transpeptidase n=2 Tax=Sphingomonas arantia TaxID=1460676 RepID=A0ABW4U0N3_9SPHN